MLNMSQGDCKEILSMNQVLSTNHAFVVVLSAADELANKLLGHYLRVLQSMFAARLTSRSGWPVLYDGVGRGHYLRELHGILAHFSGKNATSRSALILKTSLQVQ